MMTTLQNGRPSGDMGKVKIDGKGDKGKEVSVRHEIVSPKWKRWNYDDFSREWNKTYPIRKGQIN